VLAVEEWTGHACARTARETHTWIHKAADIAGLGTDAIRWIPVDDKMRIDPRALRDQSVTDVDAGDRPALVVGNAGSVSTGAVDREFGLWFHVDGAYGGPAAALPDASSALAGMRDADSVAVDPH
jgi:glutamate/tyrosine decarboxylase-like PLP-dependent enzyme